MYFMYFATPEVIGYLEIQGIEKKTKFKIVRDGFKFLLIKVVNVVLNLLHPLK